METPMSYVVLLWLGLPIVMSDSCWNYQIEHCNTYVKPYITQAAIKYYTGERLQMFCEAKTEYDSCIDHILPFCQEATRLTLQGAKDSNNYLCSQEGFNLMIKHSDCYRKQEVQQSARICDVTLRNRLEGQYKVDEKCRLADQYLTCVEDSIAKVCGHEAGDFVYEANIRVLKPIYRGIGCTLGEVRSQSHNYAYHLADKPGNRGHRSGTASVWPVGTFLFMCLIINHMFH